MSPSKQVYRAMAAALPGEVEPAAEAELREIAASALRRLNLPGSEIELEVTTLAGETVKMSDLRGKVVLIDFWATWCQPCLAELPNIRDAYIKFHDRGFEVIGYSLDTDELAVANFLEQVKLPWHIVLPESPQERGSQYNPDALKFGVRGIPFAVLVDQTGKVAHINLRGAGLDRALTQLLGEPAIPQTSVLQETGL